MEDNLFTQLESSKSLLIMLPNRPYFDQVAAGLALYLVLKNQKEVSITCPSDMLVEFNRLVGVDKITKEIGNKNLVMKFADYQASNIERVSYDIEGGEFKLTVIPKTGSNPPAKDQVLLSFSGVAADTVVLIGGANISHFPALAMSDLQSTRKIHVGVRTLQGISQDIIALARPSSSESELIATFIKQSGKNLDEDIATNLLCGIEAGSGNFSSTLVTAETFQLIADLMRAGGKRSVEEIQAADFPQGSIPQVQQEEEKVEVPSDWQGPKIYKGTSVS